jgi:chromosome segregation ATPase
MKIIGLGTMMLLGSVLGVAPVVMAASPQEPQPSSSSSLAETARRAREMKKDKPKAAKVWDNDNVPKLPEAGNVAGQQGATSSTDNASAANASAATQTQTAAPASPAPTPAAPNPEEEKQQQAVVQEQLARAREHLADLQRDLELLQRQFDLDQSQTSQNPDYLDDRNAQAKLKAEGDQVRAKQQEVDDVKKKIADLEAKLKVGGPNNP